MGKNSSRDCFNRRIASQLITGLCLGVIVAAALISTGCGRSSPSAVQAPAHPPSADTNQTPAAVPPAPQYASPPVVIAASPEGGADLKQLNHAYIGWIVQNQRHPKSIEEYVSLSGVKIPPPPAGKKYVIDKYGFINLAATN